MGGGLTQEPGGSGAEEERAERVGGARGAGGWRACAARTELAEREARER